MLTKLAVLALVACAAAAATNGPGENNIVRPCELNDYKCIGDNLAANSKCSQQVRGLPPVHVVYDYRFDTPFFNASYIEQRLIVRNHNRCFVSEFYFNVNSDSGVLSLDCPNFGLETNRTLIQHYSQQEDTSYSYYSNAIYPLIRLTANLKHADKLDICSAFVFADVTVLPIFKINPLNKQTANFLSQDLSALYIWERESFYFRGPPMFRDWVNAYICDFGCSVPLYLQ